MVLAWLLTGVVLIRENERAVVTRFGRAEADLAPGLYWRFPVPFERVYREHVGRLRTVQIGFRAAEDRPLAQTDALLPVEWTSEHNEAGFETRPEESLVLTGDEVLVEMTAEVQWRISNLRQYLFDSARPVETLRTLAESVVRETAARQPLDGILTDRRRQIEEECLAILRGRLKQHALGVEVVELTLLDVHPPRAVVGRLSRCGRRARRAGTTRERGRSLLRGQAPHRSGRTGRPPFERLRRPTRESGPINRRPGPFQIGR